MSDEITKGLPRNPSFEDQVLARLDAIDGRLHALEAESQRRAVDTKPIWERALAEILELKQGQAELKQGLAEVKEGLSSVDRKIGVLSSDVIHVRADQVHLERRVDKLEPKPRAVVLVTTPYAFGRLHTEPASRPHSLKPIPPSKCRPRN